MCSSHQHQPLQSPNLPVLVLYKQIVCFQHAGLGAFGHYLFILQGKADISQPKDNRKPRARLCPQEFVMIPRHLHSRPASAQY